MSIVYDKRYGKNGIADACFLGKEKRPDARGEWIFLFMNVYINL